MMVYSVITVLKEKVIHNVLRNTKAYSIQYRLLMMSLHCAYCCSYDRNEC